MKTNKQQRTAYNLTKLVQHVNPEDHGCALYEIAEDAGLAMIHLGTFDLDGTFVFVPQKVWDEARKEKERRERLGFTDPEYPLVKTARNWRDDAFRHEF